MFTYVILISNKWPKPTTGHNLNYWKAKNKRSAYLNILHLTHINACLISQANITAMQTGFYFYKILYYRPITNRRLLMVLK